MSVVNTGEVMLAVSRVVERTREMRNMIVRIEQYAMVTNATMACTLAEQVHAASVELLEQCEDLARSLDPSYRSRS